LILTVAAKELRSLFVSPLAWVVLAFFQLILAWIFLSRLDAFLSIQSQLVGLANPPGATELVISPVFGVASIVLVMAVPLLSMRLVAEERRNQTMTFLLSAPLSMTDIVLGKFLGLLAFLLVPVLLIGVMGGALALGGRLDWGLVASNLIGLALVAAGLAAIGLYSSCLTGHPVVAAVTALAISLVLWMINLATSDPASPLHLVSLLRHFEPFTKGVVDTGNLAYFALLIGLFLVLAIRRLDADRLRG
jgi:gliding motility-associated transport system permease protein